MLQALGLHDFPQILFGTLSDYEDITFVERMPWNDSHDSFVHSLIQLLKQQDYAAWLGRLVSTGKGTPPLQPGLLTYAPEKGVLMCKWKPGSIGDKPSVHVPETLQFKGIEFWSDNDIA